MIHDIRFFRPLTTAKVFLKVTICPPSAVSHKYIVIEQWRSQPDNLVPLCKFKIIVIIHFFTN